jgi:hypothetical protein
MRTTRYGWSLAWSTARMLFIAVAAVPVLPVLGVLRSLATLRSSLRAESGQSFAPSTIHATRELRS